MTEKKEILKRTEELVTPILDERGFDLYDIEYSDKADNKYLTILIDKEGGITLNDCEDINRKMSEILDKDDYIDDAYILEVGSPGINRKLTKDKHFEAAIGSLVDVQLYKKITLETGKKPVSTKLITGELKSFSDDSIVVDVDGLEMTIEKSDISVVRMGFDF
ncbi:MAG: ribosome maturation factor RimP [Lachnospiraceae bacterium]|nr:ribosome maturation factor RimP [Lachnospiraceae bacterium]